MATPVTKKEKSLKLGGSSVARVPKPLAEFRGADDITDRRMLRSRIEEQSGLICILKRRSDEILQRYQASQKINRELEAQVTHCQEEAQAVQAINRELEAQAKQRQEELESQREKADMLERRFRDLANTNQGIIVFMQEHKRHNAELRLENKKLKEENDSIFSQDLQDKEALIKKLTQEMKMLREEYADKEIQYRKKIAECEAKLEEQAAQHKSKETSLLDQLRDAQHLHTNAVEMCRDLRTRLQETKEHRAVEEISMRESLTKLTEEKDKLQCLSLERSKIIEEKQEEIHELVTKWKEEKQARVEAQERFEREAEAVKKDVKINAMQAALDSLNLDFDAFKKHSKHLLTQEKELNKKLRHLRL